MLTKWINIIGLVLQFIPFWLAAPELLGVDALKRFNERFADIISSLSGLLFGFLGLSLGLILGIYGFYTGMNGTKDQLFSSMYIIGGILAAYVAFVVFFTKSFKFICKTTWQSHLWRS